MDLKLKKCMEVGYIGQEYRTNYRTCGDKGLFEVTYACYNKVVQGE